MILSERPLVKRTARRGTIVSLMALTMVGLVSFLALAIDIGLMAVAKAQAQNAADLASLTAARTLSGDSTNTYNQSAATTNAQNLMTYNYILGQAVQPTHQLTLSYGSYDYNQNTQAFNANFPATSGVPYSAVAATVTTTSLPGAFSRIFGLQFLPNVTAAATAVHRPRDIALVMDLSGSMRFGTCLGFDFIGNRVTNNPDANVPAFGHYASNSSLLVGPSGNRTSGFDSYTISASNTTAPNSSYSLTYINSFYQNNAYASPVIRAFDSYSGTNGGSSWTAPTSQTPQLPPASYATVPGGDAPLFSNGSTSNYATNVKDVLGSSSTNILWELDGYSAYAGGMPDTSGAGNIPQVWTQADYSAPASPPANGSLPFNGFTKGPGYYGKTFFLWPPDPRNTNALSAATLTSYLNTLGVTNATDQSTLSSIWATWQSQGSTGLTNLQNWLKGTAKGGASKLPQIAGGNYLSTLVPGVTTWNGKALSAASRPLTYYAVCRLFNRAYPGGTAWSSTAFSADWRMRFFGTNSNTVLFNGSGSLNPPGSAGMFTPTQTYNAILSWMTTTSDPFPSQLRAGRIKYYGSIPSSVSGSWPGWGGTDQRFWVEFMDHVLGFLQTSAGSYQDLSGASSGNTVIGYGGDFTWGTKAVNSPTAAPPYMSYTDNPARPLLRFWFSPILMVDFMQNYNMSGMGNYFWMQPGDSYEAPLYTGKQAYLAAINTMEYNHPNDWFTLLYYGQPKSSSTDTYNRFNCVACPMGTNYSYARSSLLFPFSTINADGSPNNTEVTPYDADAATGAIPSANFVATPRAGGDTCFAMGLMLAYNQFAVTPTSDTTLRTYVGSSPINFPTGMAGGMGRKGAQKVIIFETDGLANCKATASLASAGSFKYYQIRYDMNKPGGGEYPAVNPSYINDPNVLNQVYSLVQQLATDYGTTRNPFRLYALGFGPVFSGPDAPPALTTLQTMQYYAGTQSSASTPLPANQIITGTDAQMSANMVAAFTTILESGVQIALIK